MIWLQTITTYVRTYVHAMIELNDTETQDTLSRHRRLYRQA